jgi:hypothetical protein
MDEKDCDITIDIDLINEAYSIPNYSDYQNTNLDASTSYSWGHDTSSYISTVGPSGPVGSSDSYITTSAIGSWGHTGVHIEEGADLTIGYRSLSKFMDQVEERLGILRPNVGLEGRWEQLKELRRQYQELEKDLLEKEKIMDILKDTHER